MPSRCRSPVSRKVAAASWWAVMASSNRRPYRRARPSCSGPRPRGAGRRSRGRWRWRPGGPPAIWPESLRGTGSAGYLVAASYCSTTLAGMRPRSLTGMPSAFAHARMSPLRSRAADVRAVRRRCPRPALRAWSTTGASFLRNVRAFFLLRSISYSEPPIPNRTVSSAGLPSRSSSSATAILVATPTSMLAMGCLHRTDRCCVAVAATPPAILCGEPGRLASDGRGWGRPRAQSIHCL